MQKKKENQKKENGQLLLTGQTLLEISYSQRTKLQKDSFSHQLLVTRGTSLIWSEAALIFPIPIEFSLPQLPTSELTHKVGYFYPL